ncbi:benzoate/H(+) symporter BenE family transporter [uncultured Kiloniella sp.]|uniref:benzoate/H(+) symporter BenE family transporter n=1 Tax=uncultured Kiloniella sp. TaxID=1133091 RepID=UPI002626B8D9|nr:benzoate/H(+) symporter BenE family transporter [uncultured Kiloniella sp.]
MNMLRDLSLQSTFMGLLVAFVGFASSFAVVLQGIRAVGASEEQAATALMILSIAMGACAIVLSLYSKLPISVAWSTPGAALLASTSTVPGGFSIAAGSFILCAILFVIAGLWKPLGRAVNKIPSALANAMLAGILLGLCLAPIKAIAEKPLFGLCILLAWIIAGRINKLLAVPAALTALILIMVFGIDFTTANKNELFSNIVPSFTMVFPEFSLAGLIGITIPLFIVTMASQNVPGIAVLKIHNYEPNSGPLIAITGLFSGISALFGGHAVNLAAITAAMCASEDAHPDPTKRYWSAVISGLGYIVFGLLSGLVTTFAVIAPGILIAAVAGLALIGAFSNAALAAFNAPDIREASAVTFLITASGVTFFGISGAFWGLLAGGLILYITHLFSLGKKHVALSQE